MVSDLTQLYDKSSIRSENTRYVLKQVYDNLEKKGYNPINQIVGYLISGDVAYISNYNDSRKIIQTLDRNDILEELLYSYLSK